MSEESLQVGVGANVYSFEFVVSDARRLKAAGMDILDPKKYEALFADSFRQLDLLTEFLKPQLDRFGVSDLQFMDDVSRDAGLYNQCMEAFIRGLRNFFRNLNANAKANAIGKAMELASVADQARAEKINSPRVEQAIKRQLEKADAEFEKELERLESGTTSLSVQES